MIKILIDTHNGDIKTDFSEKGIEWQDVALVIAEFEKIKKELLEYEFRGDGYLRVQKEEEDEE